MSTPSQMPMKRSYQGGARPVVDGDPKFDDSFVILVSLSFMLQLTFIATKYLGKLQNYDRDAMQCRGPM